MQFYLALQLSGSVNISKSLAWRSQYLSLSNANSEASMGDMGTLRGDTNFHRGTTKSEGIVIFQKGTT